MRIIDAHLHILDRHWVPVAVRTAWARQAAGRRHPERDPATLESHVMSRQSDPTAELTIAAFDSCGVHAGVIPMVDWTLVGPRGEGDLTIRQLVDRHDRLDEAFPGRFRYCAGLDPRHDDAREFAADVIERPGCAGFKLYPAAGWTMDDPAHQWVFRFAQERGVPLVIHTAPLGGDPLVTPNSRPSALAGAMQRHPEVPWVFAHAGFEAWWEEAVDIASGWRRCYLDLSLWQHCAERDYADFRRRVGRALERVGAHRILFGSDIIRGTGSDPEGKDLARWIQLFTGLGETYDGQAPVMSQEELALSMGEAASLLYRIP